MENKIIVMSLGGSVIIPDKINYGFLDKFKDWVIRLSKNHRFVIVTGGGSTARKYLSPLLKKGISQKTACLIGIGITRMNATAKQR